MAKIDAVDQARVQAIEQAKQAARSPGTRPRWVGIPSEYRSGWVFARVYTRPLPGQPPDGVGEMRLERWLSCGWRLAPESVRYTGHGAAAARAVYAMIPEEALAILRASAAAEKRARLESYTRATSERMLQAARESGAQGVAHGDNVNVYDRRTTGEFQEGRA